MATKLTSWQQIQNAVLKPTAKAMSYSVSLAVKKHLKEEIQASIYSKHTPTDYKRTKDFIKSVTIERSTVYSGRFYQNRIVFDYKRIHPEEMPGSWNRHMSVRRKNFNEGNLVHVLEEGTQSGLYQRSGALFIEKTKKWLEEKIINNGFTVADVTMLAHYSDPDAPPEKVPVGIRIRKRT